MRNSSRLTIFKKSHKFQHVSTETLSSEGQKNDKNSLVYRREIGRILNVLDSQISYLNKRARSRGCEDWTIL